MIAVVATVAQWATAIGAGFVAFQLWQTQRALRASYERTFVERYEQIIAHVLLAALLEGRLPDTVTDTDPEVIERAFFDYFELCEEELYFRKLGRITRRTWADWWEGMALQFRNDAFAAELERLVERTASDCAEERGRPTRFHHVLQGATNARNGQVYDPVEGWWRRSLSTS